MNRTDKYIDERRTEKAFCAAKDWIINWHLGRPESPKTALVPYSSYKPRLGTTLIKPREHKHSAGRL
jgi:hypothetical protein